MNRHAGIRICGLFIAFLAANLASAQDVAVAAQEEPNEQNTMVLTLHLTPPVPSAPTVGFWPDVVWPSPALAWFAVIAVLALTLRLRPLWTWRNLDALVLAAMCLLMGMREADGVTCCGHAWRCWGYWGLMAAAAYWVLRGVGLFMSRRPCAHPGTVSDSVRLVLVLAGVIVCFHAIAVAPLSDGSRDGLVGGLYTLDLGKLPYGDLPEYQTRSPLLYLLHAGGIKLGGPAVPDPAAGLPNVAMTWENRDRWMSLDWEDAEAVLRTARLVNALLFLLVLAGLYALGVQLHGAASAWTMVGIFCVFPGTVECVAHPDILLPAMLVVWSIVLALVPGVGGLLATLCIVFAGVAWPWAWLLLPPLVAYLWRQSVLQVFGSVLGVACAVVLCGVGLLDCVRPAPPRVSGALDAAGMRPTHDGVLGDAGELTLIALPGTEASPETRAMSAPLWRWLLNSDKVTCDRADGEDVLFRNILPTEDAAPVVRDRYRTAMATAPMFERLCAALRTVLETTWLAEHRPAFRVRGAWQYFAGSQVAGEWLFARRSVKVVAGGLTLVAVIWMLLWRRDRRRHLLAAWLMIASASLAASELGPVTYLVWILPPIAALWALHEPKPGSGAPHPADQRDLAPGPPSVRGPAPAPAPPRRATFVEQASGSGLFPRGPEPRITIDTEQAGQGPPVSGGNG